MVSAQSGGEGEMSGPIALAEKITAKAEAALAPLEREISNWPAEFRAIIWFAVIEVAKQRAKQ